MEDVVDVRPDHHKMGLPDTPEAEVCPDRQKMGVFPIATKQRFALIGKNGGSQCILSDCLREKDRYSVKDIVTFYLFLIFSAVSR